ncbi:MAG: hypothetical protein JNN28_12525 [Saprospiraceae bacterium]|nr:hypothetical protein [Saprospiraceae bacterium]
MAIQSADIKAQTDIVSIIGQCVDLKKRGSTYVGLCPFHTEKTPSFTVYPIDQNFHCYGCGEHGDIFSFLQKIHGVDFAGSMRLAMEAANISDSSYTPPRPSFTPAPLAPPPPPSYTAKEVFQKTLQEYNQNYFVKFLRNRFGNEAAQKLVASYFIGTSKYKPGCVLFWQIDQAGNIRGGKIMLYDPATCRRSKDIDPTWAHTLVKSKEEYRLNQCLFGEHLLNLHPGKAVGVVESEKTAVIASLYLPGRLWLASGGSGALTAKKLQVLKGRDVLLFPDLGTDKNTGLTWFERWQKIAQEANNSGLTVGVSDLIERGATEEQRENTEDLADYLLRFDLAEFQAPPPPPTIQDAPAPIHTGNRIEQFTSRLTGETFSLEIEDPDFPANWWYHTPLPTVKTDRQAKIDLMCAADFVSGYPIPFAPDEDQQRAKTKQRAKELADWYDNLKPWINTGPLVTIRVTAR